MAYCFLLTFGASIKRFKGFFIKLKGGINLASVLQAAVGAVIGVIGLLVYSVIVAALNTQTLDASTITLLNVVPVILASVIVVSIVLTGFALR